MYEFYLPKKLQEKFQIRSKEYGKFCDLLVAGVMAKEIEQPIQNALRTKRRLSKEEEQFHVYLHISHITYQAFHKPHAPKEKLLKELAQYERGLGETSYWNRLLYSVTSLWLKNKAEKAFANIIAFLEEQYSSPKTEEDMMALSAITLLVLEKSLELKQQKALQPFFLKLFEMYDASYSKAAHPARMAERCIYLYSRYLKVFSPTLHGNEKEILSLAKTLQEKWIKRWKETVPAREWEEGSEALLDPLMDCYEQLLDQNSILCVSHDDLRSVSQCFREVFSRFRITNTNGYIQHVMILLQTTQYMLVTAPDTAFLSKETFRALFFLFSEAMSSYYALVQVHQALEKSTATGQSLEVMHHIKMMFMEFESLAKDIIPLVDRIDENVLRDRNVTPEWRQDITSCHAVITQLFPIISGEKEGYIAALGLRYRAIGLELLKDIQPHVTNENQQALDNALSPSLAMQKNEQTPTLPFPHLFDYLQSSDYTEDDIKRFHQDKETLWDSLVSLHKALCEKSAPERVMTEYFAFSYERVLAHKPDLQFVLYFNSFFRSTFHSPAKVPGILHENDIRMLLMLGRACERLDRYEGAEAISSYLGAYNVAFTDTIELMYQEFLISLTLHRIRNALSEGLTAETCTKLAMYVQQLGVSTKEKGWFIWGKETQSHLAFTYVMLHELLQLTYKDSTLNDNSLHEARAGLREKLMYVLANWSARYGISVNRHETSYLEEAQITVLENLMQYASDARITQDVEVLVWLGDAACETLERAHTFVKNHPKTTDLYMAALSFSVQQLQTQQECKKEIVASCYRVLLRFSRVREDNTQLEQYVINMHSWVIDLFSACQTQKECKQLMSTLTSLLHEDEFNVLLSKRYKSVIKTQNVWAALEKKLTSFQENDAASAVGRSFAWMWAVQICNLNPENQDKEIFPRLWSIDRWVYIRALWGKGREKHQPSDVIKFQNTLNALIKECENGKPLQRAVLYYTQALHALEWKHENVLNEKKYQQAIEFLDNAEKCLSSETGVPFLVTKSKEIKNDIHALKSEWKALRALLNKLCDMGERKKIDALTKIESEKIEQLPGLRALLEYTKLLHQIENYLPSAPVSLSNVSDTLRALLNTPESVGLTEQQTQSMKENIHLYQMVIVFSALLKEIKTHCKNRPVAEIEATINAYFPSGAPTAPFIAYGTYVALVSASANLFCMSIDRLSMLFKQYEAVHQEEWPPLLKRWQKEMRHLLGEQRSQLGKVLIEKAMAQWQQVYSKALDLLKQAMLAGTENSYLQGMLAVADVKDLAISELFSGEKYQNLRRYYGKWAKCIEEESRALHILQERADALAQCHQWQGLLERAKWQELYEVTETARTHTPQLQQIKKAYCFLAKIGGIDLSTCIEADLEGMKKHYVQVKEGLQQLGVMDKWKGWYVRWLKVAVAVMSPIRAELNLRLLKKSMQELKEHYALYEKECLASKQNFLISIQEIKHVEAHCAPHIGNMYSNDILTFDSTHFSSLARKVHDSYVFLVLAERAEKRTTKAGAVELCAHIQEAQERLGTLLKNKELVTFLEKQDCLPLIEAAEKRLQEASQKTQKVLGCFSMLLTYKRQFLHSLWCLRELFDCLYAEVAKKLTDEKVTDPEMAFALATRMGQAVLCKEGQYGWFGYARELDIHTKESDIKSRLREHVKQVIATTYQQHEKAEITLDKRFWRVTLKESVQEAQLFPEKAFDPLIDRMIYALQCLYKRDDISLGQHDIYSCIRGYVFSKDTMIHTIMEASKMHVSYDISVTNQERNDNTPTLKPAVREGRMI